MQFVMDFSIACLLAYLFICLCIHLFSFLTSTEMKRAAILDPGGLGSTTSLLWFGLVCYHFLCVCVYFGEGLTSCALDSLPSEKREGKTVREESKASN